MGKLMKYLKKYWFYAMLAPIFMFLEVLMDVLLSKYMEKMVDFGVQASNIDLVVQYGLIMLAIVLGGVICGILSGVFTNIASFNFSNDLRKDVFKKIMHLSYNQTDDFSTGSLVTRVTNDITQVQNMISMALRMLIRALAFFILGIIFTLSISPKFGILLAVILPIEVLILFIFVKLVFPVYTKIQKKLDKVNTVVHENVSGARVVKAFNKEETEYDRFEKANNDYTGEILYVSKLSTLLMPLLSLLVYATSLVIYYIGGTSIFKAFNDAFQIDNMIMVGKISQAISYISMICISIMMLGMTFTNLARASASAKRLNEVLDCPLEIQDGIEKIYPREEKGFLEFKNVSFSYPKSNSPVLKNISFEVTPGETIAIVGATGCGKSTLVNLIPRFYDVSEGEILLNHENIKDYSLYDLREKIAICLQKSELFAGTIRENILWGKPTATEEEIQLAVKISQADEFISKTEEGLNTIVEEKGTSLSGGQKQRLSIARAIIKKPEVLIFDDSTSALDLVTEAKLYDELKKHLSNVTKIVVAQRIATAKNADKILVLDKGIIVDFGSHSELMKSCPLYQEIYRSQMKEGGVDNE